MNATPPNGGTRPGGAPANGRPGNGRPANGTPKIAVRDLHKSFGPKQVLRGIDLDVGVGESVVVIGGSGTGKSVLLKCILGILYPDRGSIRIDGTEVVGLGHRERETVNRKFGMLLDRNRP